MRMRIPFCDKSQQSLGQVIEGGEIENTEAFVLQDAKPLLDLVHPGTVDRHKETDKARMRRQPCLNLLSFMDAQVIKDERDAMSRRWDLPIQLEKQSDNLFLPLSPFCSSVNLPCPRIKSGKQVEGPCTLVLVLQASRQARPSGKCCLQAGTRLEIGLFINTQDHFQ